MRQPIEIPHALSGEEVRSRLTAAFPKLESAYGARCTWAGDKVLKVQRTGLDATMRIEENRVAIDLELGFILRAFRDKITSGIVKELTAILSEPPSEPPASPSESAS